jgi:hypothetical protein
MLKNFTVPIATLASPIKAGGKILLLAADRQEEIPPWLTKP